ncbi:hypothetical protein [Marinobacterium iners]|uniref:Uncharacterized protein n=1 Tax=Marinobacterium iners DSM 11526 TaxID=1122198 RepID=A0A1H3ZYS1_9GAMM|nr:hypothetical protein [Marinobacterium iners]SEA28787.1 hypothetical protein SAMN02745729_102213 [Marinobacterium iners DSM 11526]
MNTNTADTFDPAAMRMTRAAAASKGLLPPKEQAAYDNLKKAEAHNAPIRARMKLANLKAQICAEYLPQLVIKLCQKTSDEDQIKIGIDQVWGQLDDLLDNLFERESEALDQLESQLLPDQYPGGRSSFVDLISRKGPGLR